MEAYLHAFLTRTRDTDGQIHISVAIPLQAQPPLLIRYEGMWATEPA